MSRGRGFAVLLGIIVWALATLAVPAPTVAAAEPRCFEATRQCVGGRLLEYWEANGGLPVFGYPITPARRERNRDSGQVAMTQWFERARLELHPENAAPYDVLLGRLGADGLAGAPAAREAGPRAGCRWFAETGHNVCDQADTEGFRRYWEGHGLADPALSAEARSLALFGLPLTEARTATNAAGDTVLTQWFERARFEWHPNKPAGARVLLGLLGTEGVAAVPPPAYAFDGPVLREVAPDAGTATVPAPAELGAVSAAAQVGSAVLAVRAGGIQWTLLPEGPSATLRPFARPSEGGGFLPLEGGARVVYAARIVQADDGCGQPSTEIGLIDWAARSARPLATLPRPLRLIGPTPDGAGIYVSPIGCDPGFGVVQVISLRTGALERELPVLGYAVPALSPNGRTLATLSQPGDGDARVLFYDLTAPGSPARPVPLPVAGGQATSLAWSAAAGRIYTVIGPTDGSPSGDWGLWQLDPAAGTWSRVAPARLPANAYLVGAPVEGRWFRLRGNDNLLLLDGRTGNTVSLPVSPDAVLVE